MNLLVSMMNYLCRDDQLSTRQQFNDEIDGNAATQFRLKYHDIWRSSPPKLNKVN